MIYHIIYLIRQFYDFPGSGLINYLSVRSGMALILSLFIALLYGNKIIIWICNKNIEETVRDLGLVGQKEKEGTPSMGGIIIISATLIPTLMFAKLNNIYIIMLIITLLWMGFIGFIDDYIKIFKKNKKGLKPNFKILGQIILGTFIGGIMYFDMDITIREKIKNYSQINIYKNKTVNTLFSIEKHTNKTTMPFIKNNEFDYSWIIQLVNKKWTSYLYIIFIPIVIFIIISISNGANITDGIDGLTAGTSSIIVSTLGLLSWLSGNFNSANYLNIMYIPNVGEMVIFSAAFVGSLIGFLWYNVYPAQVFMGDTGSLAIGGVIAVLAIFTRKELSLPILCGVFFIEILSVILQVSYFKYTKWKYNIGKRIFLIAPLHHHFQMKGYHENKIFSRFLIIQILLAVIVMISLKIR